MKSRTVVALFLSMISLTVSCQPIRTVSVTVIGDDENPIEDVEVVVWFSGYHPHQSKSGKGLTNKDGRFEASGQPILSMITRVNKEGYYETESNKLLKSKDHDLTLILREKKNPIPLFSKRVKTVLPEIGGAFGFDLKVGDWVSPRGEGKQADIVFQATEMQDEEGELGGKIEIVFPNEGEGIVFVEEGYYPRSELVMPHLAPEGGYRDDYSRIEMGYQNENKERNGSFFLRTRKKTLPDGTEQYNYTKIHEGFFFLMGGGKYVEEKYREISKEEKASLRFSYAFNPTPNDRNLEFDPSRNLMKDLDYTERVNHP